MKKTVLSLMLLSIVSAGFAQEEKEAIELKGVTVSPLNLEYENTVVDKNMPPSVQNLERKAARFDITELDIYNGQFEAYEVFFEQNNGSIIATYDSEGKILQSYERFKDITLPVAVREHIYKSHPGWKIHKDIYIVSYYDDRDVSKVAKVQLVKDGLKKNLKLDVNEVYQLAQN
ncbi:hypothetical protein ACA086_03985 [Muriicola sp. E247]|uniref:hypothetical protein n=1 Tax=Muriicola sp. E247 TaxID=3242730 RepID=UPI0035246BA9